MNLRFLMGVGSAMLATLSGCVVETADNGSSGPPPVHGSGSGSLVVDWTIDGTKDVDQCDQSGSTKIDILVTAANGSPAGEYQQSCAAFATTIDLAPGSYSADALLLDSADQARTTSVHLRTFDILGDDQLTIPVDFDASSFYAP